MSSFTVVNRSPDGSTYFSEAAMGNWTYGTIVELVQGTFNGVFTTKDYMSIQMSAVAGFPQLFFRVYGDFNIQNEYNSNGVLVPVVQAGSVITRIEVINASGFVYNAIDGVNFVVNSDKTSFANENINIFMNSFRPGEVPDIPTLLNSNDLVTGNVGTEFLYGYGGADTIYGGGGGDALYGGNGGDQLFGGSEADDIYGEAGNDTIFGYDSTDYIDGGADFDTWALTGTYTTGLSVPPLHNYSAVWFYNIEAIRITFGEIVLNAAQVGGASTVQTIIGGSAYRDSLRIMALANTNVNLQNVNFVDWNNWSGEFDRVTVYGTSGDDTITASRVNDMIYTMDGANWVDAGLGSDGVSGGSGADTVWGGLGSDTLTGWDGHDSLNGGTNGVAPELDGDDSINGGLGNDTIRAGAGFNDIQGGDGTDTIDYRFAVNTSYPGETVTISTVINLTNGGAYLDTHFTDIIIPIARDTLLGIENVEGSERSDDIIGDAQTNRLRGWGGHDTLRGMSGADNLLGGTGNDSLEGGAGNDVLAGEAGNDVIDGGADTDTLAVVDVVGLTINLLLTGAQATGQGDDRIVNVENVITGNGNDRLTGSSLANALASGAGNDLLYGEGGNDTLLGGAGVDRMRGDLGDDLMNGGADLDTVYYAGAVNTVVNLTLTTAQNTGHGNDTLVQIENVTTADGADRLTGSTLGNVISAGAGNDTIGAGAGNDTVNGGIGDDRVNGGAGTDSLIGGLGNDTFVYTTGYGSDRIRDFQNGTDRINIVAGATQFSQVTVADDGLDTVLTFGGVTVRLENFAHTLVDASDFLFG